MDRQALVEAGQLRIGETVATSFGTTTVDALVPRERDEPVYNLEIHRERVYRVGSLGTLVHNMCDSASMHRIGGGDADNLQLKVAETRLDPPGISVLKADSADDAAQMMREAFPMATNLHKLAEVVGTASVDAIRKAGFDIIPNAYVFSTMDGVGDRPRGENHHKTRI